MPKKKVTKKGKTGLSRGRTAKQPQEEATTSDTEDNYSETPASNVDSEDVETDKSHPTTPIESEPFTQDYVHQDNKVNEDNHCWKSWEDLPDLVEELKVQKGKGGGSITYVTNWKQHRKFELDARKELLHMYFDLEEIKSACQTSLRLMRNLHPSGHNGKVSDAIRALDVPQTFEDFIAKLMTIPTPHNFPPSIHVQEPIFEESEEEMENMGIPLSGNNQRFPSPAKMAKYATPKNQGTGGIFQFGTHTTKGLSTNKAPRLAKPGEVVYSQSGSPILQRRIAENTSAQTLERVEFFNPDGTKMEVDVVYRGVVDANKIRGFKEFAKEVRVIATSRATSVRQNRVQPPRVKTGSQSAVSKSKKPEWR